MNINEYIAFETRRQSGTLEECAGMARAHQYLIEINDANWFWAITPDRIIKVANMINGVTGFRQVPAVFNQGSPAVAAEHIPRLIMGLCKAMNDERRVTSYVNVEIADALTKEFLDIHPFADGNGRVASLIRNVLLNKLRDPEILPYYYGGQ